MTVTQTGLIIDKSLSDEDLFTIMSFKEEDEESARKAFELFYEKYARLLWSLCYKFCLNTGMPDPEAMAEDIFWNTMIRIYENPSYDSSKAKVSTWMSTIAKHIAYDLMKLPGIDHSPLQDNIVIEPESFDDSENEMVLPEEDILERALATLNDREKDILMTYMRYQQGNKHLPDSVLKELAEYYSSTTINIRQIKKRSLDKVKEFIRQNSDLLS